MIKFSYFLTILFSLSLVACGNDADIQKEDELRNEVFAIHDEVMPKMSDIVNLKGQLMEMSLDSTNEAEVKAAISQLEKAEDGMMQWMNNFIQPEKMREDKKTHQEILQYLQDEKQAITKVRDDMHNSIDDGQRMLKAQAQ